MILDINKTEAQFAHISIKNNQLKAIVTSTSRRRTTHSNIPIGTTPLYTRNLRRLCRASASTSNSFWGKPSRISPWRAITANQAATPSC